MRRLKLYSAQTGFVYEYCYEGHRVARGAIEFAFSVSADRKTWRAARVLVGHSALLSWEQAHARELTPTERYAIAKMALFQAFDERPHPDRMNGEILVRAADVEAIVETLGL